VELSTAGIKQAERLRDRLAAEKIDVIYTSNLRRASLTAKIVASGHQSEIINCAELLEINFGEAEGLNFREICQRYPDLAEAWPKRDLSFRYPGGESVGDVNNRVNKFLDRLAKHAPEETILVVAHAGPLRLLICHLLAIEPWRWRQLRTDIASLSILETYPQGAILNLLNDVSHLQ